MTEDEDRLLNDLLDLDGGLTDWEVNFIEDIARTRHRLGSALQLTDNQSSKLEQIGQERL